MNGQVGGRGRRRARRAYSVQDRKEAGPRLAPNGQPSNLNARQHAQAHTPEFKRFFGDWLRVAHQRFLNGPPVARMRGNELPTFDKAAALFDWVL